MKKTRKLQILLIILVVVCVAAFAVTRYQKKQEEIKNTDQVILEINNEDVTALSWEHETSSLAFHKDDTWVYDADEAFPVDEEKINDLLSVFSEFGATFVIENVVDYGQYGLDDPSCTIHVTTENKTYNIQLGNYSELDEERYVSIGDGNVYLVSDDPYETYDVALSDLILHDEVPAWEEDVKRIAFEGAENYEIYYEADSDKAYGEDDVYFAEVDGEVIPMDTDNVDAYLQAIKDLSLLDFVTYNVTEEELEEYGLTDPQLKVTVEDSEGETFVLSIAKDPNAETDEEEYDAFVRIGESNIIYKITADAYETVMDGSCNTLRHQEMIPIAFSEISKIDISLEGTDYTLTSTLEDEERVFSYNEEEIEIDDFKTALTSVTAKNFTNEEPEQKEEIRLKFYFENENYKEMEMTIYRYDGETCLVTIDGEPTAFVERTSVVDLIEAVNAIIL